MPLQWHLPQKCGTVGLIFLSVICITKIFIITFYNKDGKIILPKVLHESCLNGPVGWDSEELHNIIRNRFLIPPSKDSYNLDPENSQYLNYKTSPSWKFAHNISRVLFNDEPPGFFVEAGALDGQWLSNTLYLEEQLGWSGLLVEPTLHNFKKMLKKNRKVWAVQACLATKPYAYVGTMEQEALDSDDLEKGNFKGRNNLLDSPLSDKEFGYKIFDSIQCLPLGSLLLALNISFINFISLDVEGVDEAILDTFPWHRLTVDVWLIEHWQTKKNGSLRDYDYDFVKKMSLRGYTLTSFHYESPDYLFISNTSHLRDKGHRQMVPQLL